MSQENQQELSENIVHVAMGLTVSVGVPGCRFEIIDVCEKIGSIFGEEIQASGREIDEDTKDVNIHIGF